MRPDRGAVNGGTTTMKTNRLRPAALLLTFQGTAYAVYDPRFPLGFGLTYAHRDTLGRLAVK